MVKSVGNFVCSMVTRPRGQATASTSTAACARTSGRRMAVVWCEVCAMNELWEDISWRRIGCADGGQIEDLLGVLMRERREGRQR